MRKYLMLFAALLILGACTQNIPDDAWVVGFYNVENLFDTEHDPGKNDYAFVYSETVHFYKHLV